MCVDALHVHSPPSDGPVCSRSLPPPDRRLARSPPLRLLQQFISMNPADVVHPACKAACEAGKPCYLHLHGASSWVRGSTERPSVYAAPSAPGIVMASGVHFSRAPWCPHSLLQFRTGWLLCLVCSFGAKRLRPPLPARLGAAPSAQGASGRSVSSVAASQHQPARPLRRGAARQLHIAQTGRREHRGGDPTPGLLRRAHIA